MPPTRRSGATNNGSIDPAILDALPVAEIRSLCRERKISSTGNKKTLVTRLRDSGFVIPAPNDQRTQTQAESNETPPRQDHQAHDKDFTEGQLNSIRRLIQESITTASREIASEAALAAVQPLQSSNSATNRPPPVTGQQNAMATPQVQG